MAQHNLPTRAFESSLPLRSLAERVIEAWLENIDLSEQSVRRLIEISQRFVSFVEGVSRSSGNSHDLARLCEQFVSARLGTDSENRKAALATMHLRRTTLRLLFRTARDLGIFEGDPTLDLSLPPRTSIGARALTDEEVALCRSFAVTTPKETRLPAAWALAEATSRTAEIPHIQGKDVDLKRGRVWIHGSPKTEARRGRLTAWGIAQVGRRMEVLGSSELSLIYMGRGNSESKQAASCIAITETLTRAGLAGDPCLRPISVVAWAGVGIFRETGRIEEVARRLGMRSLDRAARLIGFDWKISGDERR